MRTAPLVALMIAFALPALAQESDAIKREKTKLAKLEKTYASTKKGYEAARTSQPKKKAHVTATVAYADAVLVARTLESKIKYPKALRLYREALKLDPKNKTALANKKMIEDIYRSLGKPIPK